ATPRSVRETPPTAGGASPASTGPRPKAAWREPMSRVTPRVSVIRQSGGYCHSGTVDRPVNDDLRDRPEVGKEWRVAVNNNGATAAGPDPLGLAGQPGTGE